MLAFSDGDSVYVMPPAQDHKRLGEGDVGLNTGGMGAYCPYPKLTDKELKYIKEKIIQKTINGMKKEGFKYVGECLYFFHSAFIYTVLPPNNNSLNSNQLPNNNQGF